MTDDKNERERARRVFDEGLKPLSGVQDGHIDWLLTQWATARAQGDQEGYERGRAELQAANQKLSKWNTVADADRTKWANEASRLRQEAAENKAYVDRLCVEGDALQAQLAALQSKHDRLEQDLAAERERYKKLAGAARETISLLRHVFGGEARDSERLLNAALLNDSAESEGT